MTEVQGGDVAGDTRGGGVLDFGAGGEVPAPQLPAQLPAPLHSPCRVVTQHPPLSLGKDLDVPFAGRGATRQPPQGLGTGAWGTERGQTHGGTSWFSILHRTVLGGTGLLTVSLAPRGPNQGRALRSFGLSPWDTWRGRRLCQLPGVKPPNPAGGLRARADGSTGANSLLAVWFGSSCRGTKMLRGKVFRAGG